MALFKRGKNGGKNQQSKKAKKASGEKDVQESSPQKVGVVSGVLVTNAENESDAESNFADVVSRRFGPHAGEEEGAKLPPQYASEDIAEEPKDAAPGILDPLDLTDFDHGSSRPEPLRAVEPLFSDSSDKTELEVDTMAHIGRTTIITGDVVAEEDLEIQGTIEGSVRLAKHQVKIGIDGHVKATVEAHTVYVEGRITGDVVANEVVEVKAGGIIGGDVKAPRIIMHDGAVVVGGLDMSASLPTEGEKPKSKDSSGHKVKGDPARPVLKKVEVPVQGKSAERQG